MPVYQAVHIRASALSRGPHEKNTDRIGTDIIDFRE
jgi:hypothetical protein